MKRRLIAAAVALLLFSCLALVGAYNAHQFFSRQFLFSWRMLVCLRGLASPKVRAWWLLLEACALAAILWMVFGREYIKYKSKMIRVCPGIETPQAEGQGQYGTAHWLEKKEMATAFTVIHLNSLPELTDLAAHGRDDLRDDLEVKT